MIALWSSHASRQITSFPQVVNRLLTQNTCFRIIEIATLVLANKHAACCRLGICSERPQSRKENCNALPRRSIEPAKGHFGLHRGFCSRSWLPTRDPPNPRAARYLVDIGSRLQSEG